MLLLDLVSVSQAYADKPNAEPCLFEERLEANGVLTVTETIKFDAPPTESTQRIANHAPFDQDRYYIYDISEVSAMGTENFTSKVEGDYTVPSMKPSVEVKITYRVIGATRSEPGSDGETNAFTWRALQGLLVGIEKVFGNLQVDTMAQLADCTADPPGALEKCQLYTADAHSSPTPEFESATRDAGEQVTFIVGFSADQVTATARIHE